MVDACTIARAGREPVTDPDTGVVTYPTGPAFYTGPCLVQLPDVQESDVQAGEREWTQQRARIDVPMSVTGVRVDDVVTVTRSELDPDLVGRRYVVAGLMHKTFATARRLRCTEVVR
jgi:hypothetical protein